MKNTYLHQKLSQTLLTEMVSGNYRDGQKFLSLRTIRRIWKVSEPTALSSLRWLRTHDLIEPRPKSGYYLQPNFHSRASLLLKKKSTHRLPPAETWQHKARRLQGIQGGKVALLLENKLGEATSFPDTSVQGMTSKLTPSAMRCAESFNREALKHNFTIDNYLYSDSAATLSELRQQLDHGEYAAAAIYCRSNLPSVRPLLQPLADKGLPIVVLYNDCLNLPVNAIDLNNVGVGYDAVKNMIQVGHKKITVIADATNLKTHEERIKGATLAFEALADKRSQLSIFKLNTSRGPSPQLRRHFIHSNNRPTALFSCSTEVLTSLGNLFKTNQLRIPHQLSIINCSSRKSPSFAGTAIDSMHLNIASQVGKTGARQLAQIQAGEPLEKILLINARYIKHGSCQSPKNN